jgi:phosphoglucomutase
MGKDPGEIYDELTSEFGESLYYRTEVPATSEEKTPLASLTQDNIEVSQLPGERSWQF